MFHRLVVVSMLCAVAAAAADISGKWSGFPAYFVFKQEGTTVTGSAGRSASEQYAFEKTTIEGDRLSIQLGKYRADLHLEGDTILGTLAGEGESMKVFLKRVDETAWPRAFEVASVKRADPAAPRKILTKTDPGRITIAGRSLKGLLASGYHLKEYQVACADWMNSEAYDIVATYPAGTPGEAVSRMMQALLIERFKLEVHRETKDLPIYALVVDKAGLKLKPADPFDANGFRLSKTSKGIQVTGNVPLNDLADYLRFMDRPVINLTGVKGVFEVKLEFTPDDARANAAGDSAESQSIYTALHEAGLKLEARKAPVEMLVVDRAEKVPIEN